MPESGSIGGMSDFDLGAIRVRPRERLLQSAVGNIAVEPLVMQLLIALTRRAGELVSRREIFDQCWGSAPVGDDSLNRIVAALRKALREAANDDVSVETVPGAGYVLRLTPASDGGNRQAETDRAIAAGYDSWRLSLPEPDHVRMEQLRAACAQDPTNARAWGVLALLRRHAAEYGGPGTAATYVRECEAAARRATELDRGQPDALTALVSIIPLFGSWTAARKRLIEILSANPGHMVATQDLATLEMATGRIRVSKQLRDGLIARDPLGATFCYKSVYQHWSIGDLAGMDHVADRAIQLWPTHPAVWMVRLWTLAFTGRSPAATAMLCDTAARPAVPAPALSFLRQVLTAVESGDGAAMDCAADASTAHAKTGPANAMAAMFALGLLDRGERLLDLADAYFLRDGTGPVPVSHTDAEPSLNEQHRRLTQVLFTPVFARVRGEERIRSICERIGLVRYWQENNLQPDFLA